MNRFEVCQLCIERRKSHPQDRLALEDSINDVLQYLGTHETLGKSSPAIPQVSARASSRQPEAAAEIRKSSRTQKRDGSFASLLVDSERFAQC